MLSKFLKPSRVLRPSLLMLLKQPNRVIVRTSSLIPPTQYDIPIPKRLKLLYVMKVHWETIPLFFVTALSFILCFLACVWATQHKVDVVFKNHSPANNISRTMDLRNPTVHKMMIINQRYEPWPELQDVLDKMALAENTEKTRIQPCS
ncbi:unnamed protein product [Colias eurytheme]|nr:unnamed protein product [Colias eurytheme]